MRGLGSFLATRAIDEPSEPTGRGIASLPNVKERWIASLRAAHLRFSHLCYLSCIRGVSQGLIM